MTDKTLMLDSDPPTVEEALDRLAGRRAQAIELAAHVRTVVPGVTQNRKVRRNNLRIAKVDMRAVRKKAAEDKLLAEARERDAAGMPRGTF